MLRVGLTGGIGSGKSTVASALAALGAVVVDADRIAREVVAPGSAGLAAIAARFGSSVVSSSGELDRKALATLVFSDPQALRSLEAITHPLIAAEAGRLLAQVPPGRVAVYDMPLLVEKRLWPHYHVCLVVDAPRAARLERLVSRGLDRADATARIEVQATDEQRREAADIWLDNSGERPDLTAAVARLWTGRLGAFDDNLRRRVAAVTRHTPTLGDRHRLATRLELQLGPWAPSIRLPDDPDGPMLVVADDHRIDSADGRKAPSIELEDAMLRTGLVRVGDGSYASADPAVPHQVRVIAR